MTTPFRVNAALLLAMIVLPVAAVRAQELTPNAYAPSPLGTNVGLVADTYSSGDIALDPSLPVTGLHATINVPAVGYGRTFALFDHYANWGIAVPYVSGDLHGYYLGEYQAVHRTGFGDPQLRVAANLYGAPAMTAQQFASYRPQTIVGISLIIAPPLGAYNNSKLINIGSNRWSFKPELGISRPYGPWTLEMDLGAWFFTDNTNFNHGKTRSQDPIGAMQLHAIYTFKPRLWLAVDGNYYTGGRTSINGSTNFDLQRNSRIGVTLSLPLRRLQSVRVTYSRGARTTIGGDFNSIGVSYQFVWLDR